MNSKIYGAYAKNKNNINSKDANEELFNINDLVVGDILMSEKNNKGIIYSKVPSKYIFMRTNIDGVDLYKEALSNVTVRHFNDPFVDHKITNRFITNVEDLTNYIDVVSYGSEREDMLLTIEDVLDMQAAVNMISEQEKKNTEKQKSL